MNQLFPEMSTEDTLITVGGISPSYEGTYFDEMSEAFASIEESNSILLVDDAIAETYILLEAWNTVDATVDVFALEDVNIGANNNPRVQKNVKGVFNRLKEFFDKMINFITGAINRFLGAASDLMKGNQAWLKDKAAVLTNLPSEVAKSITIEAIPYWQNGAERRVLGNELPLTPIDTLFKNVIQNPQQYTGEDAFDKVVASISKLAPNKDVKQGALLWYNGGKAPVNQQFKNNAAVSAIGNMVQYIQQYDKYSQSCKNLTDAITRSSNDLKKKLNQLEKEGNKINTRVQAHERRQAQMNSVYVFDESMDSVIEGCSLFHTDFATKGLLDGIYNPTMEAGAAAASATPPPQPAQQQQTQTPAQQRANSPGRQAARQRQYEDAKNQQKGNSELQKVIKFCIDILKVFTTVATAKMTVCEAIAKHYRAVLGQVYDAVQKYNGDRKTDAENQQYNDEQKAREKQKTDDRVQAVKDAKKVQRAGQGVIRRGWNALMGK